MVSRRDFLKIAGLGAGAALLNGCAPQLIPTPQQPDPFRGPAPFATPVRTSTPRIVSPTPDVATPTPWHFTPAPPISYVGRKLCFVLWDHQLAMYDFRPRNMLQPLPETLLSMKQKWGE